ncbi:phosphonate ABC transporter, permease protein PhnE [Arthrobacter glacialis]|uniref:phosphonate ABC transporter, permease protein PhnE n=1 Tax=Arthrobacter glacialis TaxID=1664 RepID=UPI000CD4288A|nr:phosphonate ABC transporter, permease protein PhnE [Arthrobacter glacialis]POH57684.1 phosphonate ABC transporter, permease protein PhnE [Arthrobacter glacialis]
MTATALTPGPVRGIAARAPKSKISPERISASITLVVILVIAIQALVSIDISIPKMFESMDNAERFFIRVGGVTFPPLGELLYLTALTVGLVLCGTLLAAVLSVPVAILSASNTTPGPAWRWAGRFVGVLTRAVPDVVLAMVFVLMFSLGALPGIMAIGIHSVGMISKMFADAIEQVDEGPRLAIRAAGGTKTQEFVSGILPQVMPSWVATVLHRNDINLRGSVILGYVGIIGLGREMSYAFKAMDYSLGMGYAIVIFALCVLMEVVSSSVRSVMLGHAPTGRGMGDRLVRRFGKKSPRETMANAVGFASPAQALVRPWTNARRRNVVWGITSVLVVIGSVVISDIQWRDFVTFWGKVPAIAVQFWPPTFGSYEYGTMLDAMWKTIAIALAATFLTLLGSVVIGSLAARNVAPNGFIRSASRFILVVIRGIPEVILAIMLIVVTGLGGQAGTLALAICGVGLLGKLIADSFEEVNPGPERALTATGATRLQVFAGATFPQGVQSLIGHTFYLLDTNVRAATILGIVGGGGIGYYLLNAGQGSKYGVVTAIVLMILATVLVVEGLAMWMRREFR